MIIGNKEFIENKHTYICGILNVTPDSFSDGGEHNTVDAALFHTEKMIKDGADLIDVGAESTRPGAAYVSEAEEIERAVPVIERIKAEFDIPVSLDTYKAGTARAGIIAGADLINDIWGLKHDSEMGKVISEYQIPCCLMHNRDNRDYVNYIEDFYQDIRDIANKALEYGIRRDRIILDPGIGFAKDTEQNLITMRHLDRMNELGFPWLLGTSRKSMIGNVLNLPVTERLEGTLATTAVGVMNKAMFVRVHDVLENKRLVTMLEAIYGQD